MRLARNQVTLSSILLFAGLLALSWSSAQAGQGCPFDDGSCQEYCSQQGCNMGYCGHFAWIQCICRKCGDEWGWYDKVRYNPDKTVNQTELDSLKLNGTAPIILTNGGGQQQVAAPPTAAPASASVSASDSAPSAAAGARQQQQQQQQQQAAPKKPATLTTLLIPDLSDTNKLDLNDIPEENSDKFLDYLAKNHERLAQATSASKTADEETEDDQEETGGDGDADETTQITTSGNSPAITAAPSDDETVEIQISTSNNNTTNSGRAAPATATTAPQQPESAVKRLLRMAVIERNKDEIA